MITWGVVNDNPAASPVRHSFDRNRLELGHFMRATHIGKDELRKAAEEGDKAMKKETDLPPSSPVSIPVSGC